MSVKRRKEYGQHIVIDPDICHGKPTFKGTRIMVKSVLEMLAHGCDWDYISAAYLGKVSHEAIAEGNSICPRSVDREDGKEATSRMNILDEGIDSIQQQRLRAWETR